MAAWIRRAVWMARQPRRHDPHPAREVALVEWLLYGGLGG